MENGGGRHKVMVRGIRWRGRVGK
jgi:hypothetical protein